MFDKKRLEKKLKTLMDTNTRDVSEFINEAVSEVFGDEYFDWFLDFEEDEQNIKYYVHFYNGKELISDVLPEIKLNFKTKEVVVK
jgi:hypothetical protein